MRPYAYDATHRVAIAPNVANLAAPTVAELAASINVSDELAKDGLKIVRRSNTIRRTKWADILEPTAPGKYTLDVSLIGFRAKPGESERLWTLAGNHRGAAVLIVRRGASWNQPWATGDVVEAIRFRWGKRSTRPSAANEAVVFDVELFPYGDEDAARVVA